MRRGEIALATGPSAAPPKTMTSARWTVRRMAARLVPLQHVDCHRHGDGRLTGQRGFETDRPALGFFGWLRQFRNHLVDLAGLHRVDRYADVLKAARRVADLHRL